MINREPLTKILQFQLYKLTFKADRNEVDVVTHCNELQVNKVNRIEVEVVIHCNELQVNKVNRTEVEVVTHCNEQFITVSNYLHFSFIGLIHL
jgi:hypothetical protein